MAKEELLEFEGTVTDVLPDARFRVKLDNDHEITAYTAGRMKKYRIPRGPSPASKTHLSRTSPRMSSPMPEKVAEVLVAALATRMSPALALVMATLTRRESSVKPVVPS